MPARYRARQVIVTQPSLRIDVTDERRNPVPVAWFPRLSHATRAERNRWRLTSRGQGIHWNDLDHYVSVETLLAGRPSAESQASPNKWLAPRLRLAIVEVAVAKE